MCHVMCLMCRALLVPSTSPIFHYLIYVDKCLNASPLSDKIRFITFKLNEVSMDNTLLLALDVEVLLEEQSASSSQDLHTQGCHT